jgi:Family of unknown function (DUF695)
MSKPSVFDEAKSWFTARGSDGQRPIMYRGRQISPSVRGRELLPHLLVVDLLYVSNDDIGLPTEAQYLHISRFEKQCLDPLEQDQIGFISFVRTFNGVVQYFMYVQSVEGASHAISEYSSGRYDITMAADDDPKWDEYYRFLAGMNYPADST